MITPHWTVTVRWPEPDQPAQTTEHTRLADAYDYASPVISAIEQKTGAQLGWKGVVGEGDRHYGPADNLDIHLVTIACALGNHFDFVGYQVKAGDWADYLWQGYQCQGFGAIRVAGKDTLYGHYGFTYLGSANAAVILDGNAIDRDTVIEFVAPERIR